MSIVLDNSPQRQMTLSIQYTERERVCVCVRERGGERKKERELI